jgi:hypothetical protein
MARMVVSILLVGLAGCQSIALSLVGAGAGTALRYGFDGVAYRKIEVEPISARATRVRIAAKNGSLFYDTARPPRKSSPRPSSCSAPAQQMLAL